MPVSLLAWFLVLLHRRVPFVIFRTISTLLYSPPTSSPSFPGLPFCASMLHENWMPITNSPFFPLLFPFPFSSLSSLLFFPLAFTMLIGYNGGERDRVTRFPKKIWFPTPLLRAGLRWIGPARLISNALIVVSSSFLCIPCLACCMGLLILVPFSFVCKLGLVRYVILCWF